MVKQEQHVQFDQHIRFTFNRIPLKEKCMVNGKY